MPAFSVITGDLSQNGSETGYEYIADIEALGGPVMPAVGNVDRRGAFRRILQGAVQGHIESQLNGAGVTEIPHPERTQALRDRAESVKVASPCTKGICHIIGCACLSELVITEQGRRLYDASGFTLWIYQDGVLAVRSVVHSEGRRLIKRIPRS